MGCLSSQIPSRFCQGTNRIFSLSRLFAILANRKGQFPFDRTQNATIKNRMGRKILNGWCSTQIHLWPRCRSVKRFRRFNGVVEYLCLLFGTPIFIRPTRNRSCDLLSLLAQATGHVVVYKYFQIFLGIVKALRF